MRITEKKLHRSAVRASDCAPDHAGGYIMVETVFVMALLLLFGATTISLIAAGGNGFARILSRRETNANLRTALCLIEKTVRQYDVQGAIEIRQTADGQMLVFSESVDGEWYETRLYVHEGELYEALVPAQTEYDPDYGFALMALTGFRVEKESGGMLSVCVWCADGRQRQSLCSGMACRSADW